MCQGRIRINAWKEKKCWKVTKIIETENLTRTFGKSMGRKTLGWLTPEGISGFRADFHDKVSEKMPRMYEELADDITKEIKYGSILDVGTGPGYLPIEIAKRAPKVKITGIDLTDRMIEIAKKKAENAGVVDQVHFEVGDGNKLRFEDNTYDLVISSASSHHWKNPVRVLNECYRVLKPEKEAWIYDFDRNASDEDIRLWQEEVLQSLRPTNLNWLQRKFMKFEMRHVIKANAYSQTEISEIATKTKFREYEIGEKRYWPLLIKIIFRK